MTGENRHRQAIHELGSEWLDARHKTEQARRTFEGIMVPYEGYILPGHTDFNEEDGLAATVGLGSLEAQDALENGDDHEQAIRKVQRSQNIEINGLSRWIVEQVERRID